MNELKPYRFVLATENSNLGGVVYHSKYVYAQDDVDKLIAEKDKEIAELKKKCEAEKSIGATFSENGAELARWVEELRARIEMLKASHYKELNEKEIELRLKAEDCALLGEQVQRFEQELHATRKSVCLAMAKVCYLRFVRYEKYLHDNNVNSTTFVSWLFRKNLYYKWEKRWRELAKEPTWAKFLQLINKEAK